MSKPFLLFLLLFNITIHAKDISPVLSFKSVGFINDFVVHENTLYAANDMGTVDIFDIKTAKIINQISLPPITSSFNKIIPPDILSVDYLDGKVLILSVGESAYRNVWIYENHILKHIVDESKKLLIKEARFVDKEKILLATLGSDMILHDVLENYNLYNSHVSNSTIGDISLSIDKQKIIMSDESGEVKIIDTKSSNTVASFSSQNVDNIFKVAYANGVIITAGQDRRVGVYAQNEEPYHIKSDFLVFCVGISPSGKIGAFSSGEQNNLELFDTKTKIKSHRLIGHKSIITQIKFTNEQELFSSSRDNFVLKWILPQ
ncbi:MAG: nitrate reductase [Sulfurimonas sp. RIFOXYD12_FULL_33_39]|uniref:WD40 repeat domain-containing protein n=1 Tax=unclassified Sulfurimonas TaxID=2623549 RepID=UPI0008CEC8AC|nr:MULTISPECIES: WD40 repeat domain-containing protein [unclassified Sulfurimonas]OHE07116.1 MAG: nitrate reductase [Sulfurimonas sp. RIFCSPLOWO2_12_FULL_34_6]OHE09109.1 MAG: nitrate reductase [Sulfurimonas sp. RIFOXYD12_FULL_33_39]OHE14426.1 MAG: nitrate reductase [Sulfurimonas sp. RIFOXYD2_FULL_34_21]DAB28494.1 MAG TPA: nitrate reductase [Sulfurimonas sp. UBA10385]